jgi:hypothetical protein
MAEPKLAIQPLSLAEVAFEHFEEFFNSIVEQAQFTPEQQLALGEQLKASVEKRDKLGNILLWLGGQAELLREKEGQLAARRQRIEKFEAALPTLWSPAILRTESSRISHRRQVSPMWTSRS